MTAMITCLLWVRHLLLNSLVKVILADDGTVERHAEATILQTLVLKNSLKHARPFDSAPTEIVLTSEWTSTETALARTPLKLWSASNQRFHGWKIYKDDKWTLQCDCTKTRSSRGFRAQGMVLRVPPSPPLTVCLARLPWFSP